MLRVVLRLGLGLGLGLALGLGPGLGAAAAGAAVVPTIHCPAAPPAVRTLDLVERWRVGADPDDPLIGVVSDARSDGPGGEIYLLDRQLKQILIFSPEGEYRGVVGREGDGPGEFRRPSGLSVIDDLLVVRDGWPTRLVLLDREGLPAGQWRPEGNWALASYRRVPDGWIASGILQKENDGTGWHYDEAIARFDDDGRRVLDYRAVQTVRVFQPYTVDEHRPFLARHGWDLTPQGELVVSTDRDAYRLEFLDLEGELLRVVERDFTPYRRTRAEKDEIREDSRPMINGVLQEVVCHLADTEPAIAWVRARDDGAIRVGTCYSDRELPAGVVLRWDLHGPDGTLREEVRLAGDCDLTYDSLKLLDGDRAVILRNFRSAYRAAINRAEEDGPVREGDELFEIIVCDLVDRASP